MNGSLKSLSEIEKLSLRHNESKIQILICVPAPYLLPAKQLAGSLFIGAQDCHTDSHGAYTGDISADMLRDIGASHVILGHSERRTEYNETNALVRHKALAAQAAGLCPIICVGETLNERENGCALRIIQGQLLGSLHPDLNTDACVIAYEPVWAIGTGIVPTQMEIEEVHGFCRQHLEEQFGKSSRNILLLYGGSVTGNNAAEIFAIQNVDGALVGGASLLADHFSGVIEALETNSVIDSVYR